MASPQLARKSPRYDPTPSASDLSSAPRARSSVGERSLHTREVAGSKPAAPIRKNACYYPNFRAEAVGGDGVQQRTNIGFLPVSAHKRFQIQWRATAADLRTKRGAFVPRCPLVTGRLDTARLGTPTQRAWGPCAPERVSPGLGSGWGNGRVWACEALI